MQLMPNVRGIWESRVDVFGKSLRKLMVIRKKTMRYVESDNQKRKFFLDQKEGYHKTGKTFVYIDENGFSLHTNRRYAYAKRG